jgi:hypothetical protein
MGTSGFPICLSDPNKRMLRKSFPVIDDRERPVGTFWCSCDWEGGRKG